METIWIGGAIVLFFIVLYLIWGGGSAEGFQAGGAGGGQISKAIVCPFLKDTLESQKNIIASLRAAPSGPTMNPDLARSNIGLAAQQEELSKFFEMSIRTLQC